MTTKRIWAVILVAVVAVVIAIVLSRQGSSTSETGKTTEGTGTSGTVRTSGTTEIPKPPPDIIVIRPTKPSGYSTYWTIGSSDATPIAEDENYINANAVGQVAKFQAKLGNNTVMLNKLVVAFKHCSATKTTACSADADCPQGETCVTSTIRVEKYGSPDQFKWTLKPPVGAEVVLQPHDYGDPKKWRAELCGTLAGPPNVQYKDTNGNDVTADLAEGDECKMEKQ